MRLGCQYNLENENGDLFSIGAVIDMKTLVIEPDISCDDFKGATKAHIAIRGMEIPALIGDDGIPRLSKDDVAAIRLNGVPRPWL